MKNNIVTLLSDKSHVLKRSNRYLGSIIKCTISRFYLNDDDEIVYGDIDYVPALIKIIREIIDNSIDEYIRTNGRYANKIKIIIGKDQIIVEDNGRGIPVVNAVDENGNEIDILMPELAWTNLKAGSNFDDNEDSTTPGQNGEGSSLVAIWSKEFIGETCDGSNYFKIICKDNLDAKEVIKKTSKRKFTKVSFKPDLERMGLTEIDKIHKKLIEFDVLFLKETYKDINFILEI